MLFYKRFVQRKVYLTTDYVEFQNLDKSTLQSLGLSTPTFGFLDKIPTHVCLGFTILRTLAACSTITSILTRPTSGQIHQAKGSVLQDCLSPPLQMSVTSLGNHL